MRWPEIITRSEIGRYLFWFACHWTRKNAFLMKIHSREKFMKASFSKFYFVICGSERFSLRKRSQNLNRNWSLVVGILTVWYSPLKGKYKLKVISVIHKSKYNREDFRVFPPWFIDWSSDNLPGGICWFRWLALDSPRTQVAPSPGLFGSLLLSMSVLRPSVPSCGNGFAWSGWIEMFPWARWWRIPALMSCSVG